MYWLGHAIIFSWWELLMNMDLRPFFFLNTWKVRGFGDPPLFWEWFSVRENMRFTRRPMKCRRWEGGFIWGTLAQRSPTNPVCATLLCGTELQPLATARLCMQAPELALAEHEANVICSRSRTVVPLLTHKLTVPILLSKSTEPHEAARWDGGAETLVPKVQEWMVALPSTDTGDETT